MDIKILHVIGHVPCHSVLMNTTKDTELLVRWNTNTLGQDQHLIPIINNDWVISEIVLICLNFSENPGFSVVFVMVNGTGPDWGALC